MIQLVDYRNVSAKYYEGAYAAMQDLTDIPFYLDMAKRVGGSVLELACGTGRVLLPIARKGIVIHGVDNSMPMLNILKKNLEQETQPVRELVAISSGDIRSFRSRQKYPLVIIPFRPLQHMHSVEDQLAALKTAAFHLEEKGVLAFDVFYPNFDLLFSGMGEERLEIEWRLSSNPAKTVRRYYRKESVDKINQTFTLTYIFRTYQSGKLIAEEAELLKMSYYTYPHLRALFLLAELKVLEEYGSFEKMPLDNNSQQMIFVLGKGS